MKTRELKFRAWDDLDKEMYYEFEQSYTDYVVNIFSDEEGNLLCGLLYDKGKRELELMQFTGLKDKNGKEIYEGDIIQNNALKEQDKTWVIEFDRGCFGSHKMALRAMINMEIIGNIYENPELLEQ